jgi:hypothetical protein
VGRLSSELQMQAHNYELTVAELTSQLNAEKYTNNSELKEFKKIIIEHEI